MTRIDNAAMPYDMTVERGFADISLRPGQLGCADFRSDYGLRYACLAGAMYKGIASQDLVVAMGKGGFLGFLGTGGMRLDEVESSIRFIQSSLAREHAYGMNLLANNSAQYEDAIVDLFLKYRVRHVEASSYMQLTPSLIRYRLKGIHVDANGRVVAPNKVMAKLSRPEVAEQFASPPSEKIVSLLVHQGHISLQEAELSRHIPVAQEICVEADSGGHTDQGVAFAIFPAIRQLSQTLHQRHRYAQPFRVGCAGGIGTPEAAAAAFAMGADFIVTGSINQCTVEASTSSEVKDLLQAINVQDTAYAPAGDLFELGAKVQVLKKGVFFPARANKLYELYSNHESLDQIDAKTLRMLEEKYFRRTIDEVWAETEAFHEQYRPDELKLIRASPKKKMSAIFRWYFVRTSRLALSGDPHCKVDYQVHTGPALGAFNQWVKGTQLEDWRQRRVAEIGHHLMQGTAELMSRNVNKLLRIAAAGY
ncbi:PfaD family polyunsaturated fatty acid/polyketide biosynthesis protein [Tahibacter sp.]|uniref:PfaD family polyunsaturated fatty acid/polyketide biosynthesis protein n=1 Tax=Tahibacter sp. TaxID=2056211 RepID=UPI0028C40D4F|nr:PfaD family polyunsaturated fatty acid/polyketide biosynthesis protein [Tahibacter sp.]